MKRVEVVQRVEQSPVPLTTLVAKKLRVPVEKVGEIRILKRSLDARKKENVHFLYNLEVYEKGECVPRLALSEAFPLSWKGAPVAVVGSGPCGLFAALHLIRNGVPVLLFERGKCVEERKKSVDGFCTSRTLDPESNIAFGEGGAGTFSDGKLNTQVGGSGVAEVLQTFAFFGAPQEILWENKPHIGSDKLPGVVKNMREEIVKRGGKVFFGARMTDFSAKDGKVVSITAGGEKYEISALVLAVGHGARDTFRLVLEKGLPMEQKPFAVGVRVEHFQSEIDRAQYGKAAQFLPPAPYKLTAKAGERGVYTFCMCPGGTVVPAATEEGGVVVNGMSVFARDGKNANAALVCQVDGKDFGTGVLSGMEFQRKLEERAYALGGGGFAAPVCRMEDFLKKRKTVRLGEITPTYSLGYSFATAEEMLGEEIAAALREGAESMNARLAGFTHPSAVLTGVETRTSSPVRILRDESLQSPLLRGFYPAGEGAGYAGGIVSAAIDGLRVARAICALK